MKKVRGLLIVLAVILLTAGCKNYQEDKELVSTLIKEVYIVRPSDSEQVKDFQKNFPNDEKTNAIREILTEKAFGEYTTVGGKRQMIYETDRMKATTSLEDIEITKSIENEEGTVYKYKAKLKYDYDFEDISTTKEVRGMITVGTVKEDDKDKILITKINRVEVPLNVEYFENEELKGDWKVTEVREQDENLEMGDGVYQFKEGYMNVSIEDKIVEKVSCIFVDGERADVFEDDTRQMYKYSLEGDTLTFKKYKENKIIVFKKI